MTEKQLFELTKEELEKILAEGAAKRRARTHALDLPTTHADNGGVFYIYPDGRKVYLAEEENRALDEIANRNYKKALCKINLKESD